MLFFLVCLALGYPIELLDITNRHAVLLINVDEPFVLSLISNPNIEDKEKWKTHISYKQSTISDNDNLVYVELPNKLDHSRYYAYKIQTKRNHYFTKAFFYDEDEKRFITTSEEDAEQRRIGDKKKKKKEKKEKKKKDEDECEDKVDDYKNHDDLYITIGVLVGIIVLILIIVCFSACAL